MSRKLEVIQALTKLSKNIPKSKEISIDNVVFKLHYKWTVFFLLVSTTLIILQEYFGNNIECIADIGVSIKVINTFCFSKTTFSVTKHYNKLDVQNKVVPHPGIGPYTEEDTIIHHAYYQWVPFFLFLQSVMFYIPHYTWKHMEGGRLRALLVDLKYTPLSGEEDIKVNNQCIPSKKKKIARLQIIENHFLERLHINRTWAVGLVFCEILNAINLSLQIFILNLFLGGNFINLGIRVINSDFSKESDPLEFVFPKVTKCTFHKYGPSGSIQNHDALCVMSLNVVNETIYTFLWFWLLFLVLATAAGLLWRFLVFVLYSRSQRFNAIIFRNTCPKSLQPWNLSQVIDECHFSDWLFLRYISKNLDDNSFREIFHRLSARIAENSVPERIQFNNGEFRPLNSE